MGPMTAWNHTDRAWAQHGVAAHATLEDGTSTDVIIGRAILEERARLQLEIHDALGHQLTLIALHAAAALDDRDAAADDLRPAMAIIRAAAGDGLETLRRLLATGPIEADVDGIDSESMDEVAAMVERVRAAGLEVDLTIERPLVSLGRATQTTAHRLVQEALTNAMRHAPSGQASVTIGSTDDAVTIRVTTTGGDAGPVGGLGCGRGLAGMQRRVARAGGRIRITRDPGGTFTIRAWLPRTDALPVRVVA